MRAFLNPAHILPELLIIANAGLLLLFLQMPVADLYALSRIFRAAALTICGVVIGLKLLQVSGFNIEPVLLALRSSEVEGLLANKYADGSILISINERIGFGNPSDMGVFLFFTYLVNCAIKNKNENLFFLLVLAALMISQSRTFLAGLLIVFLIWNKPQRNIVVLATVIPMVIMLFFIYGTQIADYLRISNFNLSGLENADGFRIRIALMIYELLSSDNGKILFGVGYGEVKAHLEMLLGFRTTSESAFLTIIATYGLGGSALILGLAVAAFADYIPYSDRKAWLVASLICMIFIVQPLVEYIYFYIALASFLRLYAARKFGRIDGR